MGAAFSPMGMMAGKAGKFGGFVDPAGFIASKVGGTAGKFIDPAGALAGQQDKKRKGGDSAPAKPARKKTPTRRVDSLLGAEQGTSLI